MRKLATGFVIATASLATAMLLARVPILKTVEWKIYDLEFRQLANHPGAASPDIVMVKIDDLSLQRMAENDMGRFPWPRDTYAILLDYFARARPKVVAFDLLFIEEDKSTLGQQSGAQSDQEMVAATRRLGAVVHSVEVNDTAVFAASPLPATGQERYSIGGGIEEHRSVKLPFPALLNASRAIGHTFTVLDADGPIRRAVPFVRQGDNVYPSLAIATAMLALNIKPADVHLGKDGLQLGSRTIPLIDVDQEYVEKVHTRHILVPYKGPAFTDDQRNVTTYRSYRFWDLFLSELQLRDGKKPEVDPGMFRNKIIFVGTTAAGLHDLFQTPYGEQGEMPGMQIDANVVDGILNSSFVRPSGPFPSAAMLVLSAIAVSVFGVYVGFWWSLAATAVVVLIDAGFVATLFKQGVWVASVPTVLTAGVAQFSSVAYKYFVEDREKRQVRALFSRYVSPAVVKELIKDPSKARLGGERRQMTVLFADIRNFTTFSEAGQPEDVILQLNEFFTKMVGLLFEHHGTLDKFVGDMIMAIFNAPVPDPDHADHAVQMAVAMFRGLAELNQRWKAEGKPQLDIGVGINTGEMIVGNVGSEKTLSYTVIGDNVNLGSRLESLNKEYGSHIIISEATYTQLKGTYPVRPLGSAKVKGKTREVSIYEVTI